MHGRNKDKAGKEADLCLAAMDVDSKECLTICLEGRSSLHAYVFLREINYCEDRPEIAVEGFWYRWALKRLGLSHRHETFGSRNAVEGFFSRFREN